MIYSERNMTLPLTLIRVRQIEKMEIATFPSHEKSEREPQISGRSFTVPPIILFTLLSALQMKAHQLSKYFNRTHSALWWANI